MGSGGERAAELVLRTENGDNELSIVLDRGRYDMWIRRGLREFFVRCSPQSLYDRIDGAKTSAELSDITVKYGLCDEYDFDGCDIELIKTGLCAVAEMLYRFPKLRSRLCFIGSSAGYCRKLRALALGEGSLRQWGLQHILSAEDGKRAALFLTNGFSRMLERPDYLAAQVKAFGFFDGIVFDGTNSGGRREDFLRKLDVNEKRGFHPRGCNTVESVVYHEIGHILDELCDMSRNEAFTAYRNSLSDGEVKQDLSEYAATSDAEFIAEAVAEYMCGNAPRETARKTMALLQVAYRYL